MSGQIVSYGSCGEEDLYLKRKYFLFDEPVNDLKINGWKFSICVNDFIAWDSLENLRKARVSLTNHTWDTKTIRILSLPNHLKLSDTEITVRNNNPIRLKSYSSRDSERDRSRATIADILEHCGNGDWGTAIRDSLESEELHAVMNEMAEGIELGAETVASALVDVISDIGEIHPL